eukprot:10973407-Ditylum_brightwellii.AAC.1
MMAISSEENDAQYFDDGIFKPPFINVGSQDTLFEPVIDVSDSSFFPRKTTYKVLFKGEHGVKEEREATAQNLMH